MKIIKLEDVTKNKKVQGQIIANIKKGKIFIYPTDTVYGLGCDATNPESVKKIKEIKKTDHPFSVIAPSKGWIKQNLALGFPKYLGKLPGPYTLIFKKKRRDFLPDVSKTNSLGVRIPAHPLTGIIQSSGRPFVTTSANISGQEAIKKIDQAPRQISDRVDISIDAGVLDRPPSKVIDLTGENPGVLR